MQGFPDLAKKNEEVGKEAEKVRIGRPLNLLEEQEEEEEEEEEGWYIMLQVMQGFPSGSPTFGNAEVPGYSMPPQDMHDDQGPAHTVIWVQIAGQCCRAGIHRQNSWVRSREHPRRQNRCTIVTEEK
jgi:hypothetical protein